MDAAAKARARARNEAARATHPAVAGPWTVAPCGGCGAVRGMPAAPSICLRCVVRGGGAAG